MQDRHTAENRGVGKPFYVVFTYRMISHYIERKIKKRNETTLS